MCPPARGTATSRTSTSWRCTRCTPSPAVYSSVRWGWARPRRWAGARRGSTPARTPTCATPGRLRCSFLPSWTAGQVSPVSALSAGELWAPLSSQDLRPLSARLRQHRLLQLSVGHPPQAVRHQEHRPDLPLQIWRGCSPARYMVRPGALRVQENIPGGGTARLLKVLIIELPWELVLFSLSEATRKGQL